MYWMLICDASENKTHPGSPLAGWGTSRAWHLCQDRVDAQRRAKVAQPLTLLGELENTVALLMHPDAAPASRQRK